ncbi:MAG: Golgi apparatus membrane protein tvp23 [Ramalina farinacea]|uniref:Golgi apparatus membrane protein TVP23 n=1 Tax=Ramalina farinacea TaxID=258253 RepID=A0AA43QKT9_9LECA|nr:Golgi apparatus membrane protein tvp23 [Ramalina farinacea]
MADQVREPRQGDLSWRLSSHPITLLFFLAFRISSLLVYLFGLWIFTNSFVLIFIITMLLLAADFYYLKNIAGRRLVGLRWWNEVNTATGESHWVFESQDRSGSDGGITQNATDKRFFWLALYAQPALWVGLAVFALVRFENAIWLALIGQYHCSEFLLTVLSLTQKLQ